MRCRLWAGRRVGLMILRGTERPAMIPERNQTPLAATYATAAMALIGYIDNHVRLIAAVGGLWQFQLTRSAMALPRLLALAVLMKRRLWPNSWRALGLRSLFAATSMLIYFGCLGLMPIGTVLAGLFTAPIFTASASNIGSAMAERVSWNCHRPPTAAIRRT